MAFCIVYLLSPPPSPTVTAGSARSMVGLTVHTEVALLYCTQLLQLPVENVHCLLYALPLCHRNLGDTERKKMLL